MQYSESDDKTKLRTYLNRIASIKDNNNNNIINTPNDNSNIQLQLLYFTLKCIKLSINNNITSSIYSNLMQYVSPHTIIKNSLSDCLGLDINTYPNSSFVYIYELFLKDWDKTETNNLDFNKFERLFTNFVKIHTEGNILTPIENNMITKFLINYRNCYNDWYDCNDIECQEKKSFYKNLPFFTNEFLKIVPFPFTRLYGVCARLKEVYEICPIELIKITFINNESKDKISYLKSNDIDSNIIIDRKLNELFNKINVPQIPILNNYLNMELVNIHPKFMFCYDKTSEQYYIDNLIQTILNIDSRESIESTRIKVINKIFTLINEYDNNNDKTILPFELGFLLNFIINNISIIDNV